MKINAKTYEIYIAGDYERARETCRHWTVENPQCVTVSRSTFIYTHGEESGVVIGLRSYARFPSEPGELEQLARWLCDRLMLDLCQRSAMICGPNDHEWITLEGTTP